MDEPRGKEPKVDAAHGHLSVRVEGAHPPEIRFSFEQQPRRTSVSVLVGGLLQAGLVALFIFVNRLPHLQLRAVQPEMQLDQLVWLDEPGPGGGGGGGGNKMPDPPKAAEVKGKEKINVPVTPPAPIEAPKPKEEPTPVQQLSIPAVTLAASVQDLPGTIAAPGPMTASLGSGSGGGAGTGSGGGIGPGSGSGLGPGSGGGTGGGVYQPGNGVTSPQPINPIPKPRYTPEAMRARIQGRALVGCIVQPSGVCTNIEIVKSLDPTFGLDLEAINNVKQWRFKPGLRFGQPVAVQVTIEVEFTVR